MPSKLLSGFESGKLEKVWKSNKFLESLEKVRKFIKFLVNATNFWKTGKGVKIQQISAKSGKGVKIQQISGKFGKSVKIQQISRKSGKYSKYQERISSSNEEKHLLMRIKIILQRYGRFKLEKAFEYVNCYLKSSRIKTHNTRNRSIITL